MTDTEKLNEILKELKEMQKIYSDKKEKYEWYASFDFKRNDNESAWMQMSRSFLAEEISEKCKQLISKYGCNE